jgi:prepilin-type N-terminal cleavage/methylation domain-containing protein
MGRISLGKDTGKYVRGRATDAFTMVEVIVALTLLGVTILAVFGALRTCSAATHHARMLTESVLLAERLMTEARLNQNQAFETCDGGAGVYHWRVRVAPTPVESLGAIHVQVNWFEQQRPQQYDLFSLIHMQSFGERR